MIDLLAGRVDGLRLYAFEAIPKVRPYKDAYRARLDALPLSEEDRRVVLDEVTVALALNHALLAELGQHDAAGSRSAPRAEAGVASCCASGPGGVT